MTPPDALHTPLPVLGQQPPERADAARNRERILCAARGLVDRRGAEAVTMDAIAAEAGVGKGTLFRRFGDRSALLMALVDESDRRFQDSFIRGAPPLGPGAPARERLIAFGRGRLGLLEANGELLLAAESGGSGRRLRGGPYAAYRAHVRALLAEGAPELDPDYTADALLATLSAEVFMHQRRGRGIPLEQIERGWAQLVERVLR